MKIGPSSKANQTYFPQGKAYLEAINCLAKLGRLDFLIELYVKDIKPWNLPLEMQTALADAIVEAIGRCEKKRKLRPIAHVLKERGSLPDNVVESARASLERLQRAPPKDVQSKRARGFKKSPVKAVIGKIKLIRARVRQEFRP